MSMMPTSSWNCFPDLGTGTDCPRASGSGRRKIEQIDPDMTFKVGLIYGPSGCGKSSLVRRDCCPGWRSTSFRSTSRRPRRRPKPGCSRACGRRVLNCPEDRGWSIRWRRCEGVASCAPGRRCCWSSTSSSSGSTPSEARRTRNWSPPFGTATASMSRRSCWCGMISGWPPAGSCGTWRSSWSKGRTSPLVDLFDPRHARKVLTAFGRAYGTLAREHGRRSHEDQEAFLDQAIAGLAQDGKVISVRLALFAEMVKGKPWTPATLEGGRRHRGRGRHVPGRDLQRLARPPRSIASTRKPPRRC